MPYLTPPPLQRNVIRELDRHAIDELGIPGLVLMENAGEACAQFLEDAAARGELAPPFHVICGAGNNGGDGYVIARQLVNRGLEAEVFLSSGRPSDAGSDAGRMLAAAEGTGVLVRALEEHDVSTAGTIVDAIFGSGLSRPIEPPLAERLAALNEGAAPIVAIDIPSGLDADSGETLGVAVRAKYTLTLVAPKLGFSRADGPRTTGEVMVVGISIPRRELELAIERARG